MKIGLDLSVIQSPHRMRGIGATAINFVNNLTAEAKAKNQFVIFMHQDGQDEALSILDTDGLDFEIRTLRIKDRISLKLPRRLRIINSLIHAMQELIDSRNGHERAGDISDLDAYLQFDQTHPLPKVRGIKTAVILYDLIPYVMEADYLWSYKTARQHHHSRKGALRKSILRKRYLGQVKSVARHAKLLIAISKHTKDDFVRYAGIEASKIKVVHLGIQSSHKLIKSDGNFKHYVKNSWGYMPRPIKLDDKPFLLFVGGADPRRRLSDLVAAYNNLKAQGYDIRLVLAGDTMKGPDAIPVPSVQRYISSSSYLDDIVFLGFVTDEEREWLYNKAAAMVYPSVYEGFGLPVLEAMQYGTPVITYKNSSIYEVAEDAAIYANDGVSIASAAASLFDDTSLRKKYEAEGKSQAAKFSWQKTVETILNELAA